MTRLVKPTIGDWRRLVDLGQYLNGTKDLTFIIRPSNMCLIGSADASFASHLDRKGHSGGVLWFDGASAPISALSKKQTLVARSSTEAELVALDLVAHDAVWMREILSEMGYTQREPTRI